MADADAAKIADEKEGKTEQLPASSFSSSDREIIERRLNVSSSKLKSLEKLNDVYEIEKCVSTINKYGYSKVALQFPDSLLADSAAVSALLKKQTSSKVFILADTSYGSCCVDEVAAEHANADIIIHYGRACLSPTRRLPVLYVFGKYPIVMAECCKHFYNLFADRESNILVHYDVVYHHSIGKLEETFKPLYPNLIVSTLTMAGIENRSITSDAQGENEKQAEEMDIEQLNYRFGREFILPAGKSLNEYQIFYIGQGSLTLRNLMMTYNKCQFCTYDPVSNTSRRETLNINKALMRRYYLIQKAKDAQIVGIVIGTLGVADYLKIIERLKKVITNAGKKCYVFVMGKLNVAKMANFMEIDVFVLVACPENSLIDSQEFYKPIVTPYEMEIACLRAQEWTGEYITDFRELLPGASHFVDIDSQAEIEDEIPDISLITGGLRPSTKDTSTDHKPSTSLVPRNQHTSLATQQHTSAGNNGPQPIKAVSYEAVPGEFLASRTWQGLQQDFGNTPVIGVVEGRSGIAAGYTHEQHDTDESMIQ